MASNIQNDLARSAAQKQMKKTADWFAGQQQSADMDQLNRLRKKFGAKGDITSDPNFHAWVLPKGSKTKSLARVNGRPAVPMASSRLKLQ